MDVTEGFTFNIPCDTRPIWQKLGYKCEQDYSNSTHLHFMTAEGTFCDTCGVEITKCNLFKIKE